MQLRRAAAGERPNMLENYLRERLSQVLRIDSSRVGRHEPFRGLGLDSLMSLELRNRIEAALDLKLSVTLLWAHSTVAALSTYLLEQLKLMPKPHEMPPMETPAVIQRPTSKEIDTAQLAELSEGKLLEMADDALSAWEDVK
jgi:acyl carrier protein